MRKLVLVLLAFSINAFSQGTPPTLLNFRIENGQTSRVYFDSSEPISASKTVGFKISGNSIIGISIKSGQNTGHFFNVSKSFTYWDNNTLRYEGGGNIKDDDNNDLSEFTLQYIKNKIAEPKSNGNTYYVSTSGSNSNSGTSASNAWRNLSHATGKLKAGDILYIKAGNYGDDPIKIKAKGTSSNPIQIIGYKNSPNDISTMYYSYGNNKNLISSEMPLIKGNGKGKGISTGGSVSNLIIKNIQIENYQYGVDSESKEIIYDNLLVKDCTLFGIFIRGKIESKHRILNSTILNGHNSCMRLFYDFNLVDNCKVYGDDNSSYDANPDYYISIYQGSNDIIRNSYAYRDPSLKHTGHGISLKASNKPTEYNLVEDCHVDGPRGGIEFRHSKVKYSVARNILFTNGGDKSNAGGIKFQDGASFNIAENCVIRGINHGILFKNSREDSSSDGKKSGFNNKVINSTFDSCNKWLVADEGISASNNMFINNTIINCKKFTEISIPFGNTNKFINNIVVGSKSNSSGSSKMEYSYNNFWNNDFTKPQGPGNISFDPKFEDVSKGNFRLKSNSKSIDAGIKIEQVKSDKDGMPRPQGSSHDMGAFEYQDNSTSSVNANAGDDQTICKGESIILTASGGTSYQWSNGETTESIEVSPNLTRTYTVTVTEGGFSARAQVIVTVNRVTANAGEDVTINEGGSTILTASGGDSYLWNNGETTESITVSPDSSTFYSVTVTKDGCEDTDNVEVIVGSTTSSTVNAFAGEDQTICRGEVVTLTASGGSTYEWSTGETTKSIDVSPNESTVYSVTAKNGSNSATDEVEVKIININADAGEDVAINEGESATLTASGGDSYLWNNGETSASIDVNPTKTTSYTVTVIKDGCQETDTVQVFIDQGIVSDPPPAEANAGQNVTICIGESVTLTANGGSSYIWSTGEIKKNIQVNPNRTTTYTLSATRGGVTNADKVTVTVENCNNNIVVDNTIKDFEMYPNPTTGMLNVKVSNIEKELFLTLMSLNGSVIYADKINLKQGSVSKQIDLSKFAKGIYFVRLHNSNQNTIKKLMVI